MKKVVCGFLVSILMVMSGIARANDTNEIAKKKENAQWLMHPEFKHSENQWFLFRTKKELTRKPEKAIARIAADSKYWLWINGKLAILEGQIKRGPNPNDTYFDEVDLTPFLQKGTNTFAVQLCYFGNSSFSHNDSGKAGFFMECIADDEQIVSDGSWKVMKDQSMQTALNDAPNYRLSESQVQHVATKAVDGWQKEKFDDSSWLQAKEAGEEGVVPWNKLHRRIIPQWKDFGLNKVKFTQDGNRVKMKLPYNMQFHFYMKLKAPAGKKVVVTTDNYYNINGGKIIRGEYITKAGVQEYEHLPWMSGHEVYFDVEDGVKVLEVGYRETGYNSEFDGQIFLDDPDLMTLVKKAKRTLYVTMRDNFMDCPDRERAQWWGDLVLEMEETFYAMDENALFLAEKAIYELVDWQWENGVLHSPIPGNYPKELPQQMLASVGWFGFRHFVQYTGKEELYKKVYPQVKKYLSMWKVGEDGNVPFKKGGWNWSDWGKRIDKNLLEHVWYYLALKGYAEMADYMKEPQEAQLALDKMQRIKHRLNTVFWTTEGYRSPGYKDEIDDRGNGLAVVAGIASEKQFPVLTKLLYNIRHASPYMEKYVEEALFVMGETELALKRMKERYKVMIDDETTTLWEIFKKKNSLNHAWSGGPLSLLYKYVAGIQPTQKGFDEFQVFPSPAGFPKIDCRFSTVKGIIDFKYRKKSNKITETLTVPMTTKAIVRVPLNAKSLKINGKGNSKKVRKDDSYEYYLLDEGKWIIKIEE
ncbi:glycoside hydrolase [Prolixibacteraceae bacterium JC049]|nr:glycoside hydrolase [Prolixibacteraceae bacterium JC049]